jgi:hypothetical protein
MFIKAFTHSLHALIFAGGGAYLLLLDGGLEPEPPPGPEPMGVLTETPAVTLARICRFKLCLLPRRDKMRVFLEILDDLFTDHFTLEAAQRAFDRFVIIN